MAEYENSENEMLTVTCEGDIAGLLQADLNLRTTDWTNSSSELVPEETNVVQEEICESVVEEIVVDQENDNYLQCIGDDCLEESIVYVFEEQIVEYELSDFIQESETFEMEEAEVQDPGTMNSEDSAQGGNVICDESEEPGTSKVNPSDDSVNNCSENELVLNKCTVDIPISSDNSLKTCNFNECSEPVDKNLINSALIEDDENNVELETVEEEDVVYGPMPKDLAEPASPEVNTKPDDSGLEKTPNLLPSELKNKSTPLQKISSEVNSPTETKSPYSDTSSPALRTLGKDQIKKRLQSFSLMKQGITAIPIKKIISPKVPKVQMQIGEVYDETGRKTDKEIIIKKPPKQGPTPSEKAKQVIDEIEQIKREEAAIYEQTLSYMKYSMRDAHRKKSKLRRGRIRSKSPIRKDKKYDRDIPKRPRKISEDDNSRQENDRYRKSQENDKYRKVAEHVERKKRDRSPEKPKEEEMPDSWTKIKQKNIDFEKISKIKNKIFKYPERKSSPVRFKKDKNKKPNSEETNTNFKKDDYIKPQLMFEGPSLLRTSLSALGVNGTSKYYPAELIRFTEKSVPCVSYCENPKNSSILFRNRKQVFSEIPEDRAEIMMKIIENKNEPLQPGRYVSGLGEWYSGSNYLTESKNEMETEIVKSYGLSVLSEMYDGQDEQEETHETEVEKSKKESKEKKKKERKKSKKKHKKRKSKSKSRSSSKDRTQEDDENKKSKKSKNKKHEEIENTEKSNEIDSTKFEIEPPRSVEEMNSVKEEHEPNEDRTPNTEEYRSNWESDEDIINEIIPTTYDKQFKRLDKSWEIEEAIADKYEEKDSRKSMRNSSENLLENYDSRHSSEFNIEDRRSSVNLRISEEIRHEKQDNRREPEEFEYRRSSKNIRNSQERLVLRLEEMAGYNPRSSNFRRSEDKLSSRHSYDRSDSRKSFDHRQESEEKTDYEARRSSLRRSEEIERIKHPSEADHKKTYESYNRYRKISECDIKRSRDSRHESVEKIEDRLEKYDDRKTSVEKSNDRYRKTSESSKPEDEKKLHHSSEHDKRKSNERTRRDSDNRKSKFEPVEKLEEKHEQKKQSQEKIRESSERDHKKHKDKRYESRDQKHESEERSQHSSKLEINEKNVKETKKSEEKSDKMTREKKISCSSDDRKRDVKLERSRTPDRKKIEQSKYEDKKVQNMVYNKWSSDEDIQKSYKRYSKNIENSPIQLNLNYKNQRSQWSSDEECDGRKSLSDSRRSRNFEDNLQLMDNKSRSRSNESSSYRSRYENLLDDDLVNLKDLERNRKLAEEKEKHYRSIEDRINNKKKIKAEKKKQEEREKYKKNKKKIRDKKQKNKKPNVKITYSDLEESYDEDFKTAKQKEQDLFVKTNSETAKKHAAKIKIDYSDFDLSLSESKDKYIKKFDEAPDIKVESAPQTPKDRKINIDLSEIIIDHQTSKNLEIETPNSQTSFLSSVNTPESFITISEISQSPITILETPELPKSTVKISEMPKIISIPDILEPSIQKVSIPEKNVTPISVKNQEEPELRTPKIIRATEPVIEGITAIVPKQKPSPILVTPTATPVKILPDISPVAPPTPIPKPGIEPVTPVTPDPSKLVSEYEEFMKAVSFDEPKEEDEKPAEVKEIIKQKQEEIKPADSITEKSTEEESESSLEESSSEYESSESEPDTSESESLSPDSAKHRMLETVAKIKKEKVTDSENESQESSKRKRIDDSSPEIEIFDKTIVKTEKDTKKLKISEDVKTFECPSKFGNIIDWEKTCIDSTNLYTNYNIESKLTNLNLPSKEVMPALLLPENIPLPNDEVVEQIPVEDIPTPEEYLHTPTCMQSPVDCVYISSDTGTPSPTKKPRSIIPIKLLTAESRKQANETAKLAPSDSDQSPGFGKFAPKDLKPEEKVIAVDSSSDVSHSNSESLTATPNETPEDQEQASRKRHSQWALNITPSKKPLLQTNPLAEEDSDEDFTDKFIKQTEKKPELKKTEEEKPEPIKEPPPKSEPPIRDDKKEEKKPESRKPKEDDDKSRKSVDKPREKSDHKTEHRSSSPKRTPRRNSRERHDNDPKVKPRDSLDRKRERSPDRSRDRNTKENIRDRLRRLSERRAVIPDRKAPFSRGRSPRTRYSREREMQRSRRDRSKDRVKKEPERDRSRERVRERSKDIRERDRINYRRDDRRYSRSTSRERKEYRELENIPVPHHRPDDTDFSTTSMDIAQSPVNSPLDGFKRSLADSTISDSELITQLNTPEESNEPSPGYNHHQHAYPHVKDIPPESRQSPQSPKRISLDDRINLLVGLEKEPPKHIDTVCTRGPYTNNSNYDPYSFRTEYELYNQQPPPEGYVTPYSTPYQQQQYYPNQINSDNNIKVLQVGNVIQVVPTEQPPVLPSTSSIPKSVDGPPKVVQVGNMLQIVPMTMIETAAASSPLITVSTSVLPSTPVVEKPVVQKPTDQLVLERRAEKEKRRQEREQRRKEKEKKRKEKEKRRQLKIKTKTENMIKRALMLETGEGELDISTIDVEPAPETTDNNNLPLSWPPASALLSVPLPKPPSKGILVTHGFREKDESFLDDSVETRKVVKFADGICPGEGTSPSGGEELPSPPPPPRKLPKEKRYKKVKNKNKKKIKVKIIRTQQQNPDDDSSSEDNLPPPPPPPGSPPPHLWPPRVKVPPVNNIHPSLPPSVYSHAPPYPVPGSGPQQMMYPPVYPPIATAGAPVVMAHAPPPRQHHPPVMPVLQTGPPPPPPHHGAHQSSFHH